MLEDRVLIVAPSGRDATLASNILASVAVSTEQCADVAELCEEFRRGIGTALIAEEALNPSATRMLGATLAQQPAWSDIPVVVVAGAKSVAGDGGLLAPHLATIGNVTVLARPIRRISLVSAITNGLRGRHRQYQLRELLARQEDEVRQRDEFLAMLGHELRNPLAAISMASEAMRPLDEGSFKREREVIERQTRHLTRLVGDLLDVARLTNGKVALQRSLFSFRELVERALLAVTGATTAHRVIMETESDDVFVNGDAERFEQVVTNLLTNAAKYTPAGGEIHVRLSEESGTAVLSVRDSGIGIAPAMLPRIFDKFTQSDRTLDRARGGLGLGLALVRHLVELHGGEVEARSDGLGKGSTFTVRVPLGKTNPRERQRQLPFRPRPAPPRRIVVIEDNDDIREALVARLEEGGHLVMSAADGLSGLQTLLEAQPDIALVDIGLPGIDGYAVAKQARQHLGSSTKLIAITGYGQPGDKQQAFEAGFDVHLTKPLVFSDLHPFLLAPPGEKESRHTGS